VRYFVGLPPMTFCLAARDYFACYALNVLTLDPAVIAEQLGHEDDGKLLEQLYGHPDRRGQREQIRQAFVVELKAVRS
jgi:integrase